MSGGNVYETATAAVPDVTTLCTGLDVEKRILSVPSVWIKARDSYQEGFKGYGKVGTQERRLEW
jgi:hypothetical protein